MTLDIETGVRWARLAMSLRLRIGKATNWSRALGGSKLWTHSPHMYNSLADKLTHLNNFSLQKLLAVGLIGSQYDLSAQLFSQQFYIFSFAQMIY